MTVTVWIAVLPPHLRDGDLDRLLDLMRASVRTIRTIGQPTDLPSKHMLDTCELPI